METNKYSRFRHIAAVAGIAIMGLMLMAIPADSNARITTEKVLRITDVKGEVQLQTTPEEEWIDVHPYMIVSEGYGIYSGPGGFVEIELGRGHFLRMREYSEARVLAITRNGWVIGYTGGSLYVNSPGGMQKNIEVEVGPEKSVILSGAGAFRVDAGQNGETDISVRGGKLTVIANGRETYLYEGERASIGGDITTGAAHSKDSWDYLNEERDYGARGQRQAYNIYRDIPGKYETYRYSEWVAVPSYGYIWGPHLSLVFYGHLYYYSGPYYRGHRYFRRHGHRHRHYTYKRRHLHRGYGGHRIYYKRSPGYGKGQHLHRRGKIHHARPGFRGKRHVKRKHHRGFRKHYRGKGFFYGRGRGHLGKGHKSRGVKKGFGRNQRGRMSFKRSGGNRSFSGRRGFSGMGRR